MSLNLSLYTRTQTRYYVQKIQIEIDSTYCPVYYKKRFNFPPNTLVAVYISGVDNFFCIHTSLYCIAYIASTSQENYKTQQQQRGLFYMVMLSSYMVRLDTFFLLSLLCVYSVLQNRYFSFLASSAFLCVYPIFSLDPHSATQHYVCMYTAFPLLYNRPIDSISLLM